jgi:hypothetical protein
MKQKELEMAVKELKGKELTIENILEEINKFDKNIIAKNISVTDGYKHVGENHGWVTIHCLTNSIRVETTDDNIVL